MSVDSQVKVLESVVDRIDTSIEKLTEVSNSIGKLLAVHDERLNTLEKVHDRQEDDIRDLHSRISTISREICDKLDQVETALESQIKDHSNNSERMHKELKGDLDSKLKNLDDRINLLERWRWLILGGATVLGFLSNKLIEVFK
jgi:chromosome segregation ATPase